MLMTVLKGELATRQSKALIRIFRAMKDYIIETQGLASQRNVLRLSMQTTENTEAIRELQTTVKDQQKLLEDQQKAMKAFNNDLVIRYLDRVVVKDDSYEVAFEAGVTVEVEI